MTYIATPAATTSAIANAWPSWRTVAQQLAVERGIVIAHHDSSCGASFLCVRSSTAATRPSASRMTRSAMAAIAALWVITTVVVPSSALMRASASSTTTPVEMSRAPVGSSHSSTAGRFAIARAIATRCCSPPESCAGK